MLTLKCGILLCNLFYPIFAYLYVHGKYRINYEMLTLILQIGQMFIILLSFRMIILQNLIPLHVLNLFFQSLYVFA
jgi:hypothetical protein